MRNFLAFFFVCSLFFSQISISQEVKNTNGKITYKKEISVDKNNEDPQYIRMQQSIQGSLQKMRYILEFNKSQSKFYLEESMDSDIDKLHRRAVSSAKGKGVYYTNLTDKTNYVHTSVSGIGDNFLVLNKGYAFEMTNETKNINGYICYKAVAEEVVDFSIFGSGGKASKNVIYAWFTPDISLPFGPIDAYGLPGLILELQINNKRYVATEITFDTAQLNIDPPKNAKKMTADELSEMMVEMINRHKSQNE